MKIVSNILKVVAALAAVAGVVYVIATYGDKIVAYAKKLLGKNADYSECDDCDFNDDGECVCDRDCEDCDCSESEEVAEAAAEEAPAAEVSEETVEATEVDFEG